MRRRAWLACLAALALGAAAADPELAKLEQARDAKPKDAERRQALGEAYYRHARAALDRREFDAYEAYLGKAMDEVVEAARLEPASPSPHIFMGIVAAYQGDIQRTLDHFWNARLLAPESWNSHTNLAEVLVYKGNSRREVLQWIERGERRGAPTAVVELTLCLLSWRDGDLEAADLHFRRARKADPSTLEHWHGAPLPQPITTLPELMSVCCANPACGPYLADACSEAQFAVAKRQIPAEVARDELRIEMERRRKLKAIYDRNKELEIEIEAPAEATPAADPGDTPAADPSAGAPAS